MASKEVTKKTMDKTQEQEPQQKSSAYGMIVRALLIVALAYFMVKPYFDKPREDNSVRQTFKVRGQTMGTTWNAAIVASSTQLIKLNNDGVADDPQKNQDKYELINSCEELLARIVQRELDKVDSIASTYRPNSELTLFNRSDSTDWFPVSEDLAKIVSDALSVSSKTKGAFDVTVAPLVNLYRFGPNKSPLASLPTDEEIETLRARVGYDKLEARISPAPALRKFNPDVTIDLSSVAKGYAVDLVANALEKAGLNDYLVEVGGEIRCRGKKLDPISGESVPWTLGIQTPELLDPNASRFPDVYRFLYFDSSEESGVLATSGDYNNYLQVGDVRFSHFIDPRTGRPTEMINVNDAPGTRLGSVSVVSNDSRSLSCALADAYATAFSVLGEKEGLPIANELGLSVLFLYCSDDAASSLNEVMSEPFKSKINTKRADEADAEPIPAQDEKKNNDDK